MKLKDWGSGTKKWHGALLFSNSNKKGASKFFTERACVYISSC